MELSGGNPIRSILAPQKVSAHISRRHHLSPWHTAGVVIVFRADRVRRPTEAGR